MVNEHTAGTNMAGTTGGATALSQPINGNNVYGRSAIRSRTTGAERSVTMAWDDSLSDEELMLSCQKGNDAALEALYQRHYRPIFLYISRMAGSREMAEDLAQETFIRIYVNKASWKPQAKFTAWMYRIARNLCIDEKRRYWNRNVHTESSMMSSGEDKDIPFLDRVEDGNGDARTALEMKINEEVIKQAINQLSEEQREVIVLNKYQGLSYGEIAEILGSSAESIKQRAYRAHLKLRSILEPVLKDYS